MPSIVANNDIQVQIIHSTAVANSSAVTVMLGAAIAISANTATADIGSVTATNGEIQVLADVVSQLTEAYLAYADTIVIRGKIYRRTSDVKTLLDELSGTPYQNLADIETMLSLVVIGNYQITVDIETDIQSPVSGNYISYGDIGTPIGDDYINQGDLKTTLVT